MGGGGNDVLKCHNTNEIQILFAGYQKPAKLEKMFPPLYRYFKLAFGHLLKRKKSIYCVNVQINLKAILFGSSYKWGEDTGWAPQLIESISPAPRSTDCRRIFVRPLAQPLWPRGRPCHLYQRKEKHEYTWTCLGNRSVCTCHVLTTGFFAGLGMSTPEGPELHLEEIYTTGPELHLSCLDKRILHVLVWTCLHHSGLSCTCTCLDKRILCWSGYVHTIGVWAAPGRIYTTGARAAPVRVWTKEVCVGLDMSTP